MLPRPDFHFTEEVLIPAAPVQSAQPEIQAAVGMAERLHCPSGISMLIHGGKKKSMPGFMASTM